MGNSNQKIIFGFLLKPAPAGFYLTQIGKDYIMLIMEFTIHTRSSKKRQYLQRFAEVYAKLLNIDNKTSIVNIALRKDVNIEHDADGLTLGLGREVFIYIQSTLSDGETARVLAHEMVHAKQHLLGQLSHRTKNGKCYTYWMGKINKSSYLDQPWEIAAYRQESMLLHRALNIIFKEQ